MTALDRMGRTDVHRPGALIPEHYEYVGYLIRVVPSKANGWSATLGTDRYYEYRRQGSTADIHHGPFRCDICGAWYHEGVMFQHGPTGEVITAGWMCAEKVEMLFDFRAEKAKSLLEKERALKRMRRWMRLRQFVGVYREAKPEVLRALRVPDNEFVADVRQRVIEHPEWGLSEKQEGALLRTLHRHLNPPVEEAKVPVPAEDGRQTVEGDVVSVKVKDYGFELRVVMTVKVAEPKGIWLTWGTVPRALEDQMDATLPPDDRPGAFGRGARIKFDAKLQVSDTDESFSIFSRPTNAEIVSPAPHCGGLT